MSRERMTDGDLRALMEMAIVEGSGAVAMDGITLGRIVAEIQERRLADTPNGHRAHSVCSTCVCGRRARVQGNRNIPIGEPGHGPGTIAWTEHELAWSSYAARYGRDQSAERMHERGGFCYLELTQFLGRKPETWSPAGTVAERERYGR